MGPNGHRVNFPVNNGCNSQTVADMQKIDESSFFAAEKGSIPKRPNKILQSVWANVDPLHCLVDAGWYCRYIWCMALRLAFGLSNVAMRQLLQMEVLSCEIHLRMEVFEYLRVHWNCINLTDTSDHGWISSATRFEPFKTERLGQCSLANRRNYSFRLPKSSTQVHSV